MKTLPCNTARCCGRMDLLPDGEWCSERNACQRYRAFSEWDKAAGIQDYKGISVVMAVPDCGMKIEVVEVGGGG